MLFNFVDFEIDRQMQEQIASLVDNKLKIVHKLFMQVQFPKVTLLGTSRVSTAQCRQGSEALHDVDSISSQVRQGVAAKLLDCSKTGFLPQIEALLGTSTALSHLKRKFHQQGLFLSFSTQALLGLGEPYLLKLKAAEGQVSRLEQAILKKKKTRKMDAHVYEQTNCYLRKIKQALQQLQENFCYSLFYRIEAVSIQGIDLAGCDLLKKDLDVLNWHLEPSISLFHRREIALMFLVSDPQEGRTRDSIFQMQSLLLKWGYDHFSGLVNKLSWRHPGQENYVLLDRADLEVRVIPKSLAPLISIRKGWVRWLLGLSDYCYDFPKRYALLLAQIKWIADINTLVPVPSLSRLQAIEEELKKKLQEFQEKRSYSSWMKKAYTKKIALIEAMRRVLEEALLTIRRLSSEEASGADRSVRSSAGVTQLFQKKSPDLLAGMDFFEKPFAAILAIPSEEIEWGIDQFAESYQRCVNQGSLIQKNQAIKILRKGVLNYLDWLHKQIEQGTLFSREISGKLEIIERLSNKMEEESIRTKALRKFRELRTELWTEAHRRHMRDLIVTEKQGILAAFTSEQLRESIPQEDFRFVEAQTLFRRSSPPVASVFTENLTTTYMHQSGK